jgi:type I restriction enzyme, S subunit
LSWPKAKLSQCMKPAEDAHTVEADKQYPNLGIYSFGRGLFRKQPIDGALTSATTLYRIKSGQFIYSRLFAFEGAYGAVADEFDGYFVSGEYPTFDCDPVYTTAEFLAAMFQSPDIWKSVAQRSKGLGDHRQRVKVEQLLDFEIPLPPLDWQAKIVKLGHRIAAAKHLQEATALGLDAFLPAIFDQAFRGAS